MFSCDVQTEIPNSRCFGDARCVALGIYEPGANNAHANAHMGAYTSLGAHTSEHISLGAQTSADISLGAQTSADKSAHWSL